jgi:hypothetical protein
MSPAFVNTNSHAARFKGEDGGDVRLAPGQVIEAEGKEADRLTALSGVEEASDRDRQAWEEQLASRTTDPSGPSHRIAAKALIPQVTLALRVATVVGPAQRVIGDDQAPYGPPTGVTTTKLDIVQSTEDRAEHVAFADNEAIVAGAVKDVGQVGEITRAAVPLGSEVHNTQLATHQAVMGASKMLLQGAGPDEVFDDVRAAAASTASGTGQAGLSGDDPSEPPDYPDPAPPVEVEDLQDRGDDNGGGGEPPEPGDDPEQDDDPDGGGAEPVQANYRKQNVAQLRAEAESRELDVPAGATKPVLIDLLEQDDAERE